MKYTIMFVAAIIVIAVLVAYAQPIARNPVVFRGSYIVNRVAMCIDCHTPALPNGQPDESRQLSGAPIAFKPIANIPNWKDRSPNLTPAGFLSRWSDAQLTTFLMTGKTPSGDTADPPMPNYRLSRIDAQGVTAYLRSIPAVNTK